MLLFIPRSLCALKRVAARYEHAKFGATQGIRIALRSGLYRAEATDGRRAIVVQGLAPDEDPPWPGFKDLPDDACEAVVMPKDLERAAKLGDQFVQDRFDSFGLATSGNDIFLGLGNDVINTRTVEGRFPNVQQVIPKKRPLFTFRVDPKLLAETLLAMADLLPEGAQGVQFFYYGENEPLGFCAQNIENGLMIDALIVPLGTVPAPTEPKPQEAAEAGPNEPEPTNGRRRKKADTPEADGQPDAATPEQVPNGQDAPPAADVAAQDSQQPKGKKSKKAKA
jgi:hypothetical protein